MDGYRINNRMHFMQKNCINIRRFKAILDSPVNRPVNLTIFQAIVGDAIDRLHKTLIPCKGYLGA